MKEVGNTQCKLKTKVVVRMLPATLAQDIFWKLIEDRAKDKVDFWYYRPGKCSQKQYINSKAYLNFKCPEDVYDFCDFLHGHTFVNPKGGEDRATVEYSPFHKVPKPRKRLDPRTGTIGTDPDYLVFLGSLKQEVNSLPSAEVQLDKRLAEEKEKMVAHGGTMGPIITPLMEEIRAKRAARNAPRTLLQFPKRRDRGGKRVEKINKEDGRKDDKAKTRRERGGRKRDRDEKRKKKKDAVPVSNVTEDETNAATVRPPRDRRKEKDKTQPEGKSHNELWMIKRHLEPGSVQIQVRDKVVSSAATQPQTSPTYSQLQQSSMSHLQSHPMLSYTLPLSVSSHQNTGGRLSYGRGTRKEARENGGHNHALHSAAGTIYYPKPDISTTK